MNQSAFKIAIGPWVLAFRGIAAMPLLFATGFIALVISAAAFIYITVNVLPAAAYLPAFFLGRILVEVVDVAIISSILIGIHRFVILGERMDRPIWRVPGSFWRFARWALLFRCMTYAPLVSKMLVSGSHPQLGNAVQFVVWIGITIIALRLILLFPALALSAPSAEWRGARQASIGHVWKFFWVQTISWKQLFATWLVMLYFWVRRFSSDGAVALDHWRPETFGLLAVTLLGYCVTAASVSLLFMIYGEPLNCLNSEVPD